jgi:outer membrane lipoprotein
MPLRSLAIPCVLALALAGCATVPPLDASGARTGLRPYQVANEESPGETVVLWGGMIVEVANREGSTEVEVLAYPLDARQRPQLERATEGRFIAVLPGFVEPLDYPAGRFVTLRGRLVGIREGRIGERDYVYPLVGVQAAHVWPRDFRTDGPRISIGIGVSR